MNGVFAIIQARMGASRLPNKMLLCLHGLPIIQWVHHRVSQAKLLDGVIAAIPDTSQDMALAYFLANRLEAKVYQGDEQDVLGRFYEAAKSVNAKYIVRVCADNPLIAPSEIDRLIQFYFETPCDYAYNHVPKGNQYPDGLGAEIFSFGLLEEMHKNATDLDHREHLLNYLWDNVDQYQIRTFDPDRPEFCMPKIKLDLDTYDDFINLMKRPLNPDMTVGEILNLFDERQ